MPDAPSVSNAVTSGPTRPSVPTVIPEFEHRARPWLTSSGVWMGGARAGNRPAQSQDAERIQSALLKFPTTRDGRVSVIDTDTSLTARAARALRALAVRLRGL